MSSTRMAGKVLMPLRDVHGGEYPSIIYQARRVQRAECIDKVVLCTSTDPQDDIIELVCKSYDIDVHRGSLHDVLDRLYGAAKAHEAGIVVDLTGDCPLVDPLHVDALVERLTRTRAVFASNIEPRAWPDGFDVMAYPIETLEVLQEANRAGRIKHHTGWNCLDMDMRPRAIYPPLAERWQQPTWGLTLDTWWDYVAIKRITAAMPITVNACTIMDWLYEHPEILKINEGVRRKAPSEG